MQEYDYNFLKMIVSLGKMETAPGHRASVKDRRTIVALLNRCEKGKGSEEDKKWIDEFVGRVIAARKS